MHRQIISLDHVQSWCKMQSQIVGSPNGAAAVEADTEALSCSHTDNCTKTVFEMLPIPRRMTRLAQAFVYADLRVDRLVATIRLCEHVVAVHKKANESKETTIRSLEDSLSQVHGPFSCSYVVSRPGQDRVAVWALRSNCTRRRPLSVYIEFNVL
jgi:hypothetical protein